MITLLSFIPIGYLYVKYALTSSAFKAKDLWHFIPAIIYTIDYIPFFLLPGEKKISMFFAPDLHRQGMMFSESWMFPAGFYTLLSSIMAFVYWLAQLRLLNTTFGKPGIEFRVENKILWFWLLVFICLQLSLFILPLGSFIRPGESSPWIIFLFCGGGISLSSLVIFFFPQILYGVKGVLIKTEKIDERITFEEPVELKENEKMPTVKYLTPAKLDDIGILVLQYFEKEMPYLKQQYTVSQLSQELKIPPQYISAYLNERQKLKFNDFLNGYRIRYCLELLKKDESRLHTLESISEQSGFNNRNTFITAFKKTMGKTPSTYLKELKPVSSGL